MTVETRDLINNGIRAQLDAIRGIAIIATCSKEEPAIEETFNAVRLLADQALKTVDQIDQELAE